MIKQFCSHKLALLNFALLIIICLSGCPSSSTYNEANTTTANANRISANSNGGSSANAGNSISSADNGGNMKDIKEKNDVMIDLEVAIDNWSGVEAASYGLGTTLTSLWRHPTIQYNPVGVDRLRGQIKERPTFKDCQRAKDLKREMFSDEGISTVGKLYDYLLGCKG